MEYLSHWVNESNEFLSVWDCGAMLIQAPSQANKQPLEVKKFRVSVGMRQQQK